jgi:hypothetical protein
MALTQIEPYSFDSSNSYTLTNLTVTGNISVTGNVTTSGNVIATGNVTSSATLNGSIGTLANVTLSGMTTLSQSTEVITTAKTGSTGIVTHDLSTGSTFYHTGIVANFTANFTNVPTTNDRTIVVSLFLIQGATPYYPNNIQIDGVAQSILWANATVPTVAANRKELMTFSLIRQSTTWMVFGQLSSYG